MARKKKQKQTKKETSIVAGGNQPLSYQGRVSIGIARGDKVLSRREYHNKGSSTLFKFLCNALAGSYSDSLRPTKIKMFDYQAAAASPEDHAPNSFVWEEAIRGATPPISVTPLIMYDTTPKVVVYKNLNKAEVTLHFRVPFSLISSNEVYIIGIYPNNAYMTNDDDVAAYYLLTTEDGNS